MTSSKTTIVTVKAEILTHIRKREYSQALSLCNSAIKRNPKSFELFCTLGYINQLLNDKNNSINAFKNAIILDPNQLSCYINLSKLYISIGKNEESISILKSFPKTLQKRWEIHRLLAESYINQDNYSEAINEINTAYSLHPSVMIAYQKASLIIRHNIIPLVILYIILVISMLVVPKGISYIIYAFLFLFHLISIVYYYKNDNKIKAIAFIIPLIIYSLIFIK